MRISSDYWGRVMAELRVRKIVRSSNSPIADFADTLVAKLLNLAVVANSTASYDAIRADGWRYQIKARRVTKANQSRQLSAIRNLDTGGFDFLIVVVFDERRFKPLEIWQFPIDLVREHAKYRAHVNASSSSSSSPRRAVPRCRCAGGPRKSERFSGWQCPGGLPAWLGS